MTDKEIEIILKDIYFDYITEVEGLFVEHTSKDVFGKYIKIVNPETLEVNTYELENWVVTTTIDDYSTLDIVDNLKQLVMEYENDKLKEYLYRGYEYSDLIIEQLCSWKFLESDDGSIIRNGKVTMVKYAKVLPKENPEMVNEKFLESSEIIL